MLPRKSALHTSMGAPHPAEAAQWAQAQIQHSLKALAAPLSKMSYYLISTITERCCSFIHVCTFSFQKTALGGWCVHACEVAPVMSDSL